MTYISWSTDFSLYLENYLIYEHHTLGLWVMSDLKINTGHCGLYFMVQWFWFCLISWRLFDLWTSYFRIESVWPNIWPQNKCRSLWRTFHGPVILPYILTICCMNIILWDYESVWHDSWPQIKCRSLWPNFMVQWFCLIPWRLFDIWKP